MRKLVMSVIIGLGLAVGFGLGNDASACDICETKTYQEMTDKEFAMHVRDEHIETDSCTEEHYECMECEGYFCDNLTCWCGEEVERVYMTYEQLCQFDQAIYELYLNEYCTNLCEECNTYYYKDCMCDSCSTDCYGCIMYDYELFVEDNYNMIMNIYERVLEQLADYRETKANEVNEPMIICEF